MNPLPGGKGKIFLQPLNMAEAGAKPPPMPTPSPDAAKYLLDLASLMAARKEFEALPGPPLDGQTTETN